ncbi:MAG TPA: DUF3108 domain-containing protein [Paludibacter sp.]|nr:DUF3108 domain-containing protein [Paludibacter sp.]
MLKLFYVLLILFIVPVNFFSRENLKLQNKKIKLGETLNYTASWGFLTIGTASTIIDKKLYRIGSNICYKIDMKGQTNGVASVFYLHNSWTAYIDTKTFTTHRSFRSIREGNYQKDEIVYFDQPRKLATLKIRNKQTLKYETRKVYKTTSEIRDYVAGSMLVRLLDFPKYNVGDTLSVQGFYEEKGYRVDVIYVGKEYVKTGDKKIRCCKIKPILPDKSAFTSKNAVEVWISDDYAQKVIRIRANMLFGNIDLDLNN